MQRRSPSFYRKRIARQAQLKFNVNRFIRVPEVTVIDETGVNLGAMKTAAAQALADERGFDLVEVQPNLNPPVCRILDFNQFQYEQDKHRQKQRAKQKKVEVKGVRLSFRISEHDKATRLQQAKKFIDQGHKVKIELILRGRERGFGDQARGGMEQFAKALGDDIFIEQPFSKQGGRLSLIVAKKS